MAFTNLPPACDYSSLLLYRRKSSICLWKPANDSYDRRYLLTFSCLDSTLNKYLQTCHRWASADRRREKASVQLPHTLCCMYQDGIMEVTRAHTMHSRFGSTHPSPPLALPLSLFRCEGAALPPLAHADSLFMSASLNTKYKRERGELNFQLPTDTPHR